MEKSRDLHKRSQARRRRTSSEAAPVVDERRSTHPLLRLQQQVGNAQVSRMLAQRDDDLTWIKPEIGPEGGALSNRLVARIQASRGGGAPLDQARRAQMEDAFDARLDDVRLHTDQEADALNRSISARAFTIGSDIFFRREADPNDPDLLAHELAHVVQQRAMNSDGPLTVGPADDGLEREAQHVAQQGSQDVGTLATPNLTHTSPGGAASVQRGFFDDLMGTVGSIGSGISNVVGTITGGGGASDIAGSVGGGISDVGGSIGGGVGDVMGSIGGGVSDVASTIGGGGGVGDIVSSASSGLGGMLGSLGQGGIGNIVSSVGGGLGGMLSGGGGGLGGMLGSLGSGLGGMLGSLGGGGGLGGMLGSLGGGGGLGGMLGSLGGGLGGMLGSLGGGGGILDRLFGR